MPTIHFRPSTLILLGMNSLDALGLSSGWISVAGLTVDIFGVGLLSWDLIPDFVATRARRDWNTHRAILGELVKSKYDALFEELPAVTMDRNQRGQDQGDKSLRYQLDRSFGPRTPEQQQHIDATLAARRLLRSFSLDLWDWVPHHMTDGADTPQLTDDEKTAGHKLLKRWLDEEPSTVGHLAEVNRLFNIFYWIWGSKARAPLKGIGENLLYMISMIKPAIEQADKHLLVRRRPPLVIAFAAVILGFAMQLLGSIPDNPLPARPIYVCCLV